MDPLRTAPAAPDERYAKFTAAGAVFFICIEVMYFALSERPSFFLPSVDGFNNAAIGRDFLNIWMGGRAALGEGPAAWFDLVAYNAYLRDFFGRPDLHDYFWSYPPHILLFIWPFGLMPYLLGYALWCALGMALLMWAATSAGVERRHLIFIAAAPAAAMNVFFGQNGFYTTALLIGGLALLDRRPILAGVLFGILTIKPQLGLLLPVMLLLTGRWRTIAAAALTAALLVAVTAALYGPEIWSDYIAKVVPQQHYLQENGDGLLLLQIPSAFYSARLIGLPLNLAWALQALISALGLAAVVWTFWRRRDPTLSLALLITAVFIVSPYTLNYDMVLFTPVLALLRQRQDNAPADHYLILALWLLPVAMLLAGIIYVPLGLAVLLAVAGRLLFRLKHGAPARAEARPQGPALALSPSS